MKRRLSKNIRSGGNPRTPINSSSPAAAASSSPALGSASKLVGSKELSTSPSTVRVANNLKKDPPPSYRSSSDTSLLAAKESEDTRPSIALTGSTIQATLQPKKTGTLSDAKAPQPVQIQLRGDEEPVWDRAVEMAWAKPPRKDEKPDQAEERVFTEIWRLLLQEYHGINKPKDENYSDSGETSTDSNATHTPTPNKPAPTVKLVKHRSYSDLPPTVRLHLLRYLLAAHDLNPNKAVPLADRLTTSELTRYHGPNQFTPLSTLLAAISRYLLISRSFRADLLATLFLTYRFHILVSALTPRSIFSRTPEGQFLTCYGHLFANVAVEVDMTKLSGSKDPDAEGLVAIVGAGKVAGCLDSLVVKSQVENRPETVPVSDLRVLVRRYYGARPNSTPLKFYASAEEVEKVITPLKQLSPFVEKITISGVMDVTQAMEMIRSVCGTGASLSDGVFEQRLPAKEWGAIQGEGAVVDFGTPQDGNEREGLWVVKYTDGGRMECVRRVREGEDVVGCHPPTATFTAVPDNVKQAGQRVVVLDTDKLSRLPVRKTRASASAKAEAQAQSQAPAQSSSGLSRAVSVSFRRALSAMGRENVDTPSVQVPPKSLAAEKDIENKLPRAQAQGTPVVQEKEKGHEEKAAVVGITAAEGKQELTETGVVEEDRKGVKKGDTLRGGRGLLRKLGGALRSLGQN